MVCSQVIHRVCGLIYTDFKSDNYLKNNNIIDIFDLLTELTTTTVYINTTYKEQ